MSDTFKASMMYTSNRHGRNSHVVMGILKAFALSEKAMLKITVVDCENKACLEIAMKALVQLANDNNTIAKQAIHDITEFKVKNEKT